MGYKLIMKTGDRQYKTKNKTRTSSVLLLISVFCLLLLSCAPVLRKDLMSAGTTNVPLEQMKGNPLQYEGKLYILGGLVVKTRNTEKGSLIEAVFIPVDSQGYLKGREYADGRFLALLPRGAGLLDPEIYSKGREVTLAGEFTGTEHGKLDNADYIYPTFEIKQIYLWEENRQYYMGSPYYGYPYSPWAYPPYAAPYGPYPYGWNDPFWRGWGPRPYGWW